MFHIAFFIRINPGFVSLRSLLDDEYLFALTARQVQQGQDAVTRHGSVIGFEPQRIACR